MEKLKKASAIILTTVLVLGFLIGKDWFKGQMRHSEYHKHIIPLANQALDNLSIHDQATISFANYSQLHIDSCHLANQLLEQSTNKPFAPFTDSECLEYMEKSRPHIEEIKQRK